jgi:hypothetical protein
MFQNYIEEIQQVFPNVGKSQIKRDINLIYKDFSRRTEILERKANLTFTTSTVSYALPSDLTKLIRIDFLDSAGTYLDAKDSCSYIVENGYIYFVNSKGEQITQIPSTISAISLYYVYIPTAMATNTDIPSFPMEFEDALVYGVMAKYHNKFATITRNLPDGSTMLIPDKTSAQFYEIQYEKSIREAKKYANSKRSYPSTKTRYYQYG